MDNVRKDVQNDLKEIRSNVREDVQKNVDGIRNDIKSHIKEREDKVSCRIDQFHSFINNIFGSMIQQKKN